jgi:hypothetical protein
LIELVPKYRVLPEDGDRIQSPKHCVLNKRQDRILNKNKKIADVQKDDGCETGSVGTVMA